MTKEEQTPEVIVELCNLTQTFIRQLQPRYYKQSLGRIDPYDLAMEAFTKFMTPRGRKGQPQLTLLDKFNPKVTNLAYLVKVCCTRYLIDTSRSDPMWCSSIERLTEESGDLFHSHIIELAERTEITPQLRLKIISKFRTLEPLQRNTLFAELYNSQSELVPYLTPALKYVHGCPVQQVTDKTAVLYLSKKAACINFTLSTGIAQGTYKPFRIPTDLEPYDSGFDRKTFESYLQSIA